MSEHGMHPDPIFILGVPRSGTTLVRTILDSHPAIACGPETPWLADHQPRSAMSLWRALTEEPWGYCASFDMPREVATGAIARMIDELLMAHARARGKQRWAEKTPDNLLHVGALAEWFPRARFVHVTRNGLDVALSTARVEGARRGVSAWHEENLGLGKGTAPNAEAIATRNTPLAAALRWGHWDRLLTRALAGRPHFRLAYEDLVRAPEAVLRPLCDFLGERFEPAMLDFAGQRHEFPAWEWGSADVRGTAGIAPDRVGRGERELSPVEQEILRPIVRVRAEREMDASPAREAFRAVGALANVEELESDRFRTLMGWINDFAGPLGLRTFTNWSKVWEYPWLWLHGLADRLRPGATLVDLGSELSPMPWIAALMGARVHLIETDAQFVPLWTKLRDGLRVDAAWSVVGDERLPLESGIADVLTSFSVIEHQPDKRAAIDEAIRVLRPGGLLALSFDVCEPEMGMAFPAWNGRALTMREFEETVWRHGALRGAGAPAWNTRDIPAFLEWHRQSAPHHTYITGAAVLEKE